MKKLTVLLTALLMVNLLSAQVKDTSTVNIEPDDDTVVLVMSEHVKVVFPSQPEMQPLPTGGTLYILNKDPQTTYTAMGIDLGSIGLTADFVKAEGIKLWEQLKEAIFSQLSGVTITKDQARVFKGRNSFYIELDGINSDDIQFKGKKAYTLLFFEGRILNQFMYLSSAKNSKPEDANVFFNSIVVEN